MDTRPPFPAVRLVHHSALLGWIHRQKPAVSAWRALKKQGDRYVLPRGRRLNCDRCAAEFIIHIRSAAERRRRQLWLFGLAVVFALAAVFEFVAGYVASHELLGDINQLLVWFNKWTSLLLLVMTGYLIWRFRRVADYVLTPCGSRRWVAHDHTAEISLVDDDR